MQLRECSQVLKSSQLAMASLVVQINVQEGLKFIGRTGQAHVGRRVCWFLTGMASLITALCRLQAIGFCQDKRCPCRQDLGVLFFKMCKISACFCFRFLTTPRYNQYTRPYFSLIKKSTQATADIRLTTTIGYASTYMNELGKKCTNKCKKTNNIL